MTIHYERQQQYLIQDLTAALLRIEGLPDYLGYDYDSWHKLSSSEKEEFLIPVANDLLYELRYLSVLYIGNGKIIYNQNHHIIQIHDGHNCVHIVHLN